MTPRRLITLVIALILILLSWRGVGNARNHLTVRSFVQDGVPMVVGAPEGSQNQPGVLVAHGFTGSKQLMLGYGYTLAHGGYPVLLFDFDGHGANPTPLDFSDDLGSNFETAYETLIAQPEVDGSRVAVLGHSMGSGVVMSASVNTPDNFAATIAVSPSGSDVTPEVPKNLQIQVGEWEGPFVSRAKKLLVAAGGENGDLAAGRGRSLVFIPQREHITILFSAASHQSALNWLNQTFQAGEPESVASVDYWNQVDSRNQTVGSSPYVDRRLFAYIIHLLAWLVVLGIISPLTQTRQETHAASKPLRPKGPKTWVGLLLAPVVGTNGLMVMTLVQDVENLGGITVGGALGLWFLLSGLTWLGILRCWPRPTAKSVAIGLGLFSILWIAFGVMAQWVWLQWWLIPPRLILWPLLALACFPWFWAAGLVQQNASWQGRVFWWLGQSGILIVGLGITVSLLPQLGFLFILIPVFPIVMALFAIAAALVNESWGYALGSALFFGWMIAAVFPLVA